MTSNPAQRAAKAAGSQTALAKALGCTPQNVQRMCATGQIPAKHVIRIEKATGISRHELRPDLYPEQGDPMVCSVEGSSTQHTELKSAGFTYSNLAEAPAV